MKLDLVFTEQEEKINLDFGEYSVISNGGYDKGYTDGYDNGYINGESVGYTNGYKNGEDIGHSKGYAEGEIAGQIKGKEEGEQIGYENALSKLKPIEITANGEYLPNENEVGFNKVSVNVKSSAPKVAEKEVDFIDYDGTLLYSYSVEEAKALTELPPLPEQDGLICQGWNWSLEDIKEYLNTTSPTYKMTIGAMYITDDGKTRIYITLNDRNLSPYVGFATTGKVIIDWGDGLETLTVSGSDSFTVRSYQHKYSQAGDYVISLEVVSGNLYLLGDTNYGSQVIWKKYTTSSSNLYYNRIYQNAIQKVEIGKNCNIGGYAFYYCYGLTTITIPNSTTFSDATGAFYMCYKLKNIIIPNNITSINSYLCSNCYSLINLSLPNSVQYINSNAFYNCKSLKTITIPNNVANIPSYMVSSNEGMTTVIIGSGVNTIQTLAFRECFSMAYYDFSKCTSVPSLVNKEAFASIPTDCRIRVPMALVDAWKSATNWSTYASKIVGV